LRPDLVLHDRVIAERGTATELMRRNSVFAELCKIPRDRGSRLSIA
jgi:ABC-type multidrug transport system fused ATPase/permease subunit